jgi:hypothetical protein
VNPQLTPVVKVKVTLRLTVSQSVSLGAEPNLYHDRRSVGQSASLSWNKAPIWDLRADLYYCQTDAGLLMWGALSDERTGLSFAIAICPRQRSHSRVRIPWNSWPYFTVLDSRLPFSSPPTTRRATVEVFDPASTRIMSHSSVHVTLYWLLETMEKCLSVACMLTWKLTLHWIDPQRCNFVVMCHNTVSTVFNVENVIMRGCKLMKL